VAVQRRALSATELWRREWSKRFAQKTKDRKRENHPCRKSNTDSIFPNCHHLLHTDFSRRISHVISYHFEDRNPHAFQTCVLFVFLQGHNCTHSHTVVINTDSHTRTSWKNRTAHASSFANTITVTF